LKKGYVSANSGWVPAKAIRPHLLELVQRYNGSRRATAEAIDVSDVAIGKILHRRYEKIQKETARKILDGLLLKRQIDRRNHKHSPERREAIRQQAIMEERLERLSGY
jgi:hypothetical protein